MIVALKDFMYDNDPKAGGGVSAPYVVLGRTHDNEDWHEIAFCHKEKVAERLVQILTDLYENEGLVDFDLTF